MVGGEIPQSRGKEPKEARYQKLGINSFPATAVYTAKLGSLRTLFLPNDSTQHTYS